MKFNCGPVFRAARLLKATRTGEDWTRARVARDAGMTPNAYGRLEDGQPTLTAQIDKAAQALGCDAHLVLTPTSTRATRATKRLQPISVATDTFLTPRLPSADPLTKTNTEFGSRDVAQAAQNPAVAALLADLATLRDSLTDRILQLDTIIGDARALRESAASELAHRAPSTRRRGAPAAHPAVAGLDAHADGRRPNHAGKRT